MSASPNHRVSVHGPSHFVAIYAVTITTGSTVMNIAEPFITPMVHLQLELSLNTYFATVNISRNIDPGRRSTGTVL